MAAVGGLPDHFVLYGGTALALHLGHRTSVDFDFFSARPFVPRELYEQLDFLAGGRITQQRRNTLTVQARASDEPVSVSFFGGLRLNSVALPRKIPPGVRIAGIEDILGCKCATVQQRQSGKDVQDICAVLRHTVFSLSDGLGFARAIYGQQFNSFLSMRALTYPAALESLPEADRRLLRKAVQSVGRIEPAAHRGCIGEGVSSP